MRNIIKKGIASVALASVVALSATPADAQRYYGRHYHHHGDDAALAIGAGILGLGLGAAVASSNRGYYNNGYYTNGYYGNGYYNRGYYGRPYYGNGYAYGRRCGTHRVWDDYSGRWIRVRSC
jgi:hypothetical protein